MKLNIDGVIKSFNDTLNNDSSVHNMASDENSGETSKIYQIEEAGEYVETIYKGIKVFVRENYPYYNPQNDKIYYSEEEEAEDLYQIAKTMSKSSIHELDI
ncbi:hypothetical protein [Methanosphaera sp. WGK6]|uniref:hypothetical protein n=1 Tax=Methanosphaera sp. WGK6 TaxID=1561964 RepID=UPI00084C2F37|nr:hypothetical protein [Methanosphaera sp. WGK6]OED30911.1 hypothetical protein NL43_00965 [Methanosphaera sp. WGK6]